MKTTRTAEAVRASEPSGFGLEVVKVVREYVPLAKAREGYGETVGSMIDRYLVGCAAERQEVQSVTLQIGDEAWQEYAKAQREHHGVA